MYSLYKYKPSEVTHTRLWIAWLMWTITTCMTLGFLYFHIFIEETKFAWVIVVFVSRLETVNGTYVSRILCFMKKPQISGTCLYANCGAIAKFQRILIDKYQIFSVQEHRILVLKQLNASEAFDADKIHYFGCTQVTESCLIIIRHFSKPPQVLNLV